MDETRSLKECYEIAKRHHDYWTDGSGYTEFMCLAAARARACGELTPEEYSAITEDAMSLVKSLSKSSFSLKEALGSPPDSEVKDFWDEYIGNLGSEG